MMGIGKPHQPANFEVANLAIFSRCRNIKGEPKTLGSFAAQGYAHFFLRV